MEVNYKNCRKYKSLLDTDEQFYKNKILSVNEIKQLKVFRFQGFKEKLQKKRIFLNRAKMKKIKDREIASFRKRKDFLEKKMKESSEALELIKYYPKSSRSMKGPSKEKNNSKILMRDSSIGSGQDRWSNNNVFVKRDSSYVFTEKLNELVTTEATERSASNRKMTSPASKAQSSKLDIRKNNSYLSVEWERELERVKERERKKKEMEETEKIENDHHILRNLYRDSEEYVKMRKLKEYDRNVLNLSNVNHLIGKSNTARENTKQKKDKVQKTSNKSIKGILKPKNESSNLKLSLPLITPHHKVTISPKNESRLFLTEQSIINRENLESSKELLISADDLGMNKFKSAILESQKRKTNLPFLPGSNKFPVKDAELLNSIYGIDPTSERDIQKVKQKYKYLPLEAYQRKLINSVSHQLGPQSMSDLAHKFSQIRELSNSVSKEDYLDFRELRKKLKKDVLQFDENKKFNFNSIKHKYSNPSRHFKFVSKKKVDSSLQNIEKYVPKYLYEKLKVL